MSATPLQPVSLFEPRVPVNEHASEQTRLDTDAQAGGPASLPAERREKVDRVLRMLDVQWHTLRFERQGSRMVIEVLDEDGEVVRSIPPEELRALAEQHGVTEPLLVDERG